MNRLAAFSVIGSALLAACATTPDQVAGLGVASGSVPVASLAASALPSDPPPAADVETVEMDELDSGLVCETKRRPGSRIGATVCYTREQREAINKEQADAAQQYARDLDRERALKEQQGRPLETQQRAIIAFQ